MTVLEVSRGQSLRGGVGECPKKENHRKVNFLIAKNGNNSIRVRTFLLRSKEVEKC